MVKFLDVIINQYSVNQVKVFYWFILCITLHYVSSLQNIKLKTKT